MDRDELIQLLKDLEIFETNEYFYKYVDLIWVNRLTEKQLYITQRHHVIPINYFTLKYSISRRKAEKLYKKTYKDLLVNLKQSDHILAHSFLYLSIKDKRLKLSNYYPLMRMLKSKTLLSDEEVKNIEMLEVYQKVCEEGKKLSSEMSPQKKENNPAQWKKHAEIMRSEEVRKKISETMKQVRHEQSDYIYIHKDKSERRISPDLLSTYLCDGWKQGTLRGKRCRLHNAAGQETTVFKDEVKQYLEQGWILGGRPGKLSPEHKAKLAASHTSIDDRFRAEQSERLKNFYQANPDWKTKSKHAVKIINPETGEEKIFDSCLSLCRGTDIPEFIARAGAIKRWVEQGYIKRKHSMYNNWKIMYLQ